MRFTAIAFAAAGLMFTGKDDSLGRLLAILTLALLANPSISQSEEKVGDTSVEANPGRPTVTPPATLTPLGYLRLPCRNNVGCLSRKRKRFNACSVVRFCCCPYSRSVFD
jgi:hypothetical protein